jgi:phytoene dehydrogenase-like protein
VIADAPTEWFASGGIASSDADYKQLKDHFTDVMSKALIKHFPQLRGHIASIEIGTPRTCSKFLGSSSSYGVCADTASLRCE